MPILSYLDDTYFEGSIHEFNCLVYCSSLLAIIELNITNVQIMGNPPMWTPMDPSVSVRSNFNEAFEYYYELLASRPELAYRIVGLFLCYSRK